MTCYGKPLPLLSRLQIKKPLMMLLCPVSCHRVGVRFKYSLQLSVLKQWGRYVARVGERKGAYRILVGKPEGRRPLGRTRRRWQDSIKMDLRDVGWGGMDWIDLAQDRDRWRAVVNAVMNLLVL